MKIKTVCEVTGLTDRTIRYYIEEELITPTYTENYLGRKSFDFSHEDMDTLKNISILRRFDFTIDEIRQIIIDANASTCIIANVRQRTQETVAVGEEKLRTLSKLSNDHPYTLEQLADELSKPSVTLPVHKESVKRNPIKLILSVIKALLTFALVWTPVLLSLFEIIFSLSEYHYPVFNYILIGLTISSFWPSIAVVVISKLRWKWKKYIKPILLVFCVLSLPISFILSIGIVTHSETTDIRNYRDLDVDCIANRNSIFQDLFPIWAHYFENVKQADGYYKTEYLDAHYYYRYIESFDYTYDIYAEWPLSQEDYTKEVKRATEVLKQACDSNFGDLAKLKKGDYNCVILYDTYAAGDMPFEQVTDNYEFYIFAYNDQTKTVRYICCSSLENGVDQPYYLTLDW